MKRLRMLDIKRPLFYWLGTASFCLLVGLNSSAQDIHFSQYYLSPLSTSPAATGDFEGDYRVSAIHRNQWRSVTSPYSTFQLSIDANEPEELKKLGLGLRIFNDRAGDSRLNSFSAALSIASNVSLSADSSLKLHMGLELGYSQRGFDYSGLRFDRQYDATFYNPSLSNGELQQGNSIGHMDLHGGFYLKKTLDSDRSWSIGASAWNLSAPKVNFKSDEVVRLDQRFSLYGDYTLEVASDWHVLPSARVMLQGAYQELLLGARLRYTWQYDARAKRRAWFGAYSRLEDGAYAAIGIEHDDWTFGLSYDVNLSSLEVASRNRGGFEVAAIKIFDIFKETRKPYRNCIDLL